MPAAYVSPVPPDFVLPAALQTIGEEAFSGVDATVVYLPDSVTAIEAGAFRNAAHLRQIRISATVVTIAPDALEGVPSAQLTIFGTPGSAAEDFAALISARFIAE